MRATLLSYALGVLLMSYAPRILTSIELILICVGIICMIFVVARNTHVHRYSFYLCVIGMGLGILWMDLNARQLLDKLLPPTWESRDIWVDGYVASLPSTRSQISSRLGKEQLVQRFEFAVYEARPVDSPDILLPMQRLRLSWYGRNELLRPAERWHLRVRLKRPHGFLNPGGGDYAAYLLAHGVHASGYVRYDNNNKRLDGLDSRAYHHRLRDKLRSRLSKLHSGTHRGLILALGIGDRSMLDHHTKTLLRNTGTAHLLAISGLHIGFVAFLSYQLCVFLMRFSARALLFAPLACWGAVAALLGAFVYAMLAGFPLPARRALVMVVVAMSALLLRRRLSFSAGFCVALVVVLSLQPLAGHTAGFWLSFIAVMAILLSLRTTNVNYVFAPSQPESHAFWRVISTYLSRMRSWAIQVIHVQYAATIALIVPLGIFFHEIPVGSFVANLLAIPLVSFIIVPLIFMGFALSNTVVDVAQWAFLWADATLDFLMKFLATVPHLLADWNIWYVPAWPLWVTMLAILGSLLSVWFSTWRHRLLALLLLTPLLWKMPTNLDTLRVETLDVGQGLAVLIQTANHTMLYDAGPRYGSSDAGQLVLIPAMRYRGIKQLDLMLLSHRDDDHVGGAQSVLNAIPVERILISAPHASDSSPKSKLFNYAEHCHSGQEWSWDGVDFRILHPSVDFPSKIENNRSCVLLIHSGERNILIGGDIDKHIEIALLEQLASLLPLDALHASHHGSISSSSKVWVNQVKPDFVFYSAGYRNQFKHPHPTVRKRFARAGSSAFNTATHGAILLRVGTDNTLDVISRREQNTRFWH